MRRSRNFSRGVPGIFEFVAGGGRHIFINFFYNAIFRNLNSQGGAEGTPPSALLDLRVYTEFKTIFSFDFVSFNAIVHYV